MPEYIDRDAVYDAILVDGGLNAYGKAYCLDIVKKIPAADVVQVRHGRLVNANRRAKTYQRICTACGGIAYFCGVGCSYKFCPNCGCSLRETEGTKTMNKSTLGQYGKREDRP